MPHPPPLDALAQRTAQEIVARHASDCGNAPALRNAIARLARAALQAQVLLFELAHLPAALDEAATIRP